MNIYAAIPMLSTLAYLVLIGVVATRPMTGVHRVFLVYVSALAIWALGSFVLHADYFPSRTFPINQAIVAVGGLAPISYFHFVRTFFKRRAGVCTVLGYVILGGFAFYVSRGGLLVSSYVRDGILYHEFDRLFLLFAVFVGLYQAAAVFYLVQGFGRASAAKEKNRIGYLLIAVTVWILFATTNLIPSLANYSVDQIGSIISAVLIAYAMLRYQLLNVSLVVRRGIAYVFLLFCFGAIYAGIVWANKRFLPELPLYSSLMVASSLTILVALMAPQLRRGIQERVDRLFYRGAYSHRKALLSFSSRMGTIIDLAELANEILPAFTKALRVNGASLLLQDGKSGDFSTQFAHPEREKPDGLRLGLASPIILRLEKENASLEVRQIDSFPDLKGLWQSEKVQIASSGTGLLCPIKSRGGLIGVLALGKKLSGASYSHEDIDLISNVAGQAGVIIENAQLYSQALVRANTDGLTGLYNHRYFHERLEQEIARSSRYGHIFSIIMLDIDLFKTYNDNFGHLAGDDVLRRIGEYMKSCVRSIDLVSRYGGEEFAAVMPQTRIEDAYVVAERMRKTIEARTSARSSTVTVSIGVASWPLDGVMKEEIIAHADAALYHAKRTGRNRTVLSSEVGKPDVSAEGQGPESKPQVLSTIYALAATVDAKDHYTYGHSRKVSEYAVAIAGALGLSAERVAIVRAAALLHDIGKIGIPDAILNKSGPLTEEEWEVVRDHPKLGVEILRHVVDLVNCLPAILHHHEHISSEGYPSGFRGENIPLEARILSIADAFDAMTSQRPYRELLTPKQALAELARCAGTQFDGQLVGVFRKIIGATRPAER